MNTNPQIHTVSFNPRAAYRAVICAAAVAIGFAASAASAQVAPTQPAPVTAPSAPAATPSTRATSQYETVFRRVDADNDGSIIKSELEKADAKLGQDFQKYDTDGDGKLSMMEFEAMMKAMRG